MPGAGMEDLCDCLTDDRGVSREALPGQRYLPGGLDAEDPCGLLRPRHAAGLIRREGWYVHLCSPASEAYAFKMAGTENDRRRFPACAERGFVSEGKGGLAALHCCCAAGCLFRGLDPAWHVRAGRGWVDR